MKSIFIKFNFILTLAAALLATTINAQSIVPPGEILALTNVTVIDGNSGRPKPNMTLVISRERIAEMFSTGKKRLPAGATVMDLSGQYIMPGLIDSHYHFIPYNKAKEEVIARFALLGGITSVRDMAGDGISLAELANAARDNNVQSPRIYFSALMAGSTWFVDARVAMMMHGKPAGQAAWARAVKPDTDIVKAVTEAKAAGATGIKLYADLPPDVVTKITKEAHRQGLKVWSHATIFPSKPSDAIKAGVDVISHSVMMAFEFQDKLPEISDKSSYRNINWKSISVDSPTITALLRQMRKQGTMLDDVIIHTNMRQIPGIVKAEAALPEEKRLPGYANYVESWTYGITRRAHELGIPLVAGTDFSEHPESQDFPNIHTEMELLVAKCGLTPIEAITTATRNGAMALGIEKSYGTIARGKIADLVILSADPGANIQNTTKILYVIKGGKVYKREKVVMPAT
ncbi:MAG: amidohydrolase family protein [Acidobacteriota bacterium]|jgi:imidazolonepropionase-like amidohydrolase|nr:amidohydrolase family protein [Acidobacteriota bacterium]MDQ3373441.1 amidohydrolase family protein [Acidobacteriota bacterium]